MFAADHFNQRKLLIVTQVTMGAFALVYIFAFLFGGAAAFDAPVRQTFVADWLGMKTCVTRWRSTRPRSILYG